MEEESFKDWATREALTNPKSKAKFVEIYRLRTTNAIKNLILAKNWEETRMVIEDWRAMDRDLGMAVNGCVMDENLNQNVTQIKDVMDMMHEKEAAGEL